jgi:integrase
MRVPLKGIHKVRRKLASGDTRVHYYAWRGGPKIDALPGTPEFHAAYVEAVKGRNVAKRAGTLTSFIEEFRASSDFKGLSESSRRAYRTYLDLIEVRFGTMTRDVIEDPEARGDFKAWRDEMVATPRKADYAWTVLARVMSFAKDRGRIRINPCERGGRLYRAARTELIWTEDHIARFVAEASHELGLALVLALWTGQRQGDLLALTWTSYSGKEIRLKQSKTERRVVIPAGETLRSVLDVEKRRAVTILTNQTGASWTPSGFRASWRKACDRAGIKDVTFHDLRGTAVTRLALAGCSVPEIASLTGHSLKDVESILDAHYLGRNISLAESAMRKREETERRTKA